MVYASEHPATAALEILVHVKRAQLLRDHYSVIEAEVPDTLIRSLDLDALPEGWDASEETAASTGIGDAWFDQQISVALRVPSVVIRGQFNVLLNPLHPDWPQVTVDEAKPFAFDPRLA